jgi:CheY-like chemotaxis protein
MEDKKVLVVLPSKEEVHAFKKEFSSRGWETLLANDAIAAVAAALRQRPDAIVLNHSLPGGGGLIVLRRIRASVHTAATSVIAIVDPEGASKEEFLLHKADHCVSSPADPSGIADLLQSLIGKTPGHIEAPASIIKDPVRVESLVRTGLLDSEAEKQFDILTELAANMLKIPVCLVSLVDVERQFFKSQWGLPEPWATIRETPVTESFCQWVVSNYEPLIVNDAREMPGLSQNPVIDKMGVLAYAGIPLSPLSGEPIGSLCAVDTNPRQWSEESITIIKKLSKIAESCIAIAELDEGLKHGKEDDENFKIKCNLATRSVGEGISVLSNFLFEYQEQLEKKTRKSSWS